MVCNHYVWHSIFRNQLENGLHKVPTTPPSLESDRVSLHLRVLFCIDLQPVQGLLLGDIPAPLCPGQHCFRFLSGSAHRKDTSQQKKHAFENPRGVYWRDYTHCDMGLLCFGVSCSVLIFMLFTKITAVFTLWWIVVWLRSLVFASTEKTWDIRTWILI